MIAFIFDTETSGLIDNRTIKIDRQPSIIEFYGCLVDLETGEIKSELDLLIEPPKEVSEEITNITSITNDMLKGKPLFEAVASLIATAIENAPIVIAHNLSFDREMVDVEFERLGKTIKWPRLLCTVEATIHLKGFRLSLSNLHETLFNEPFAGAHRARVDVQALVRCCVELFKRGEI
jgi:DNA polymerase III epsilon subunit-like protein